MPGAQTLLHIMLHHFNAGRISLERLVDLLCFSPAKIYNIASKGKIEIGYDGDFTIVDLNAKRTISKDWLSSKCGWSPFEGVEVVGWPMGTIIRGNIVMQEDELINNPLGKPLRFSDI